MKIRKSEIEQFLNKPIKVTNGLEGEYLPQDAKEMILTILADNESPIKAAISILNLGLSVGYQTRCEEENREKWEKKFNRQLKEIGIDFRAIQLKGQPGQPNEKVDVIPVKESIKKIEKAMPGIKDPNFKRDLAKVLDILKTMEKKETLS